MHFQNISKFWHLWLKPTSISKHPTNPELDNLKEHLLWYLPTVLTLFKLITIGQIKWFFHHQWKSFLLKTVIILLIIFSSYYLVVYVKSMMNRDTIKIVQKEETIIYTRVLRSWEQFNIDVGKKESGNNWEAVNEYGMLGYYQFDPSTLKNTGFIVSKEDFLSDSILQKCAFKYLIKKNRKTYSDIIAHWNYKNMKNIRGTVTESGILMAFHLRPESALIFFNSNGTDLGKPDANGVTVNQYIELFNGYNIPF